MEEIISLIKSAFLSLLILLGMLVVAALLAGRRAKKEWEYEAKFRDANGRQFGEFDIELSQVAKEELQPTIKAKLQMRHPSLTEHQIVQVLLDKRIVLEAMVESTGSIFVSKTFGGSDLAEVSAGQTCKVMLGDTEVAAAPLEGD